LDSYTWSSSSNLLSALERKVMAGNGAAYSPEEPDTALATAESVAFLHTVHRRAPRSSMFSEDETCFQLHHVSRVPTGLFVLATSLLQHHCKCPFRVFIFPDLAQLIAEELRSCKRMPLLPCYPAVRITSGSFATGFL